MAGEPYDTEAVFTLPNILSFIRLLGIPLFLWLLLGPKEDVWAVVVLAAGALTDFLDGKIARAWNQRSRIGQVLDPAADRLYIWATLVGLWLRDVIPLWLLILLAARDALMGVTIWPALRARGYTGLPVHFLGKAATFLLLYSFPLVLLGAGEAEWQLPFRIFGWASVIWGTILYWWSAGLYIGQGIDVIRRFPSQRDKESRDEESPVVEHSS
ncbi:MAG: CDP-alcohol phosphatidyltransferase family protein [Propionibacteriaceae bacterium]|nr:CDP-alcohol phosphatidyltransferase family protein [Propionibacteriaceae bacterium]